jgi:hypothetical protein
VADYLRAIQNALEKAKLMEAAEDGLAELLDELGGIAGADDLADFFEVTPAWIRKWAKDNVVPRVGNSFAFDLRRAVELGEAIDEAFADDDDAEDDDDGAEDNDDADDEDAEEGDDEE